MTDTTNQRLKPYVNTIDDPPIYFLGVPTLVRATGDTTNGAFGFVEHLAMPPGSGSPYHTHRLEDEAFYILDGSVAFIVDGTWTTVSAGAFVFGPRNIPHGFKVVGERPAHVLLVCTPAGFEQFVLQLSEPAPAPPDMAKLIAVAARFQIEIHGPLPEQPAGA